MGEISSRTSHCNRTAAISRSELVILPLGLSSLTAYLVIYYGNCTNQTILGYDPVAIIHTPPAPDAYASMYPTSSNFPLVSSYTLVGLDCIYVNMSFQSLNASNNALCFPNDTRFGFSAIDLLNSTKSPFPPGKPIAA